MTVRKTAGIFLSKLHWQINKKPTRNCLFQFKLVSRSWRIWWVYLLSCLFFLLNFLKNLRVMPFVFLNQVFKHTLDALCRSKWRLVLFHGSTLHDCKHRPNQHKMKMTFTTSYINVVFGRNFGGVLWLCAVKI